MFCMLEKKIYILLTFQSIKHVILLKIQTEKNVMPSENNKVLMFNQY